MLGPSATSHAPSSTSERDSRHSREGQWPVTPSESTVRHPATNSAFAPTAPERYVRLGAEGQRPQ